MSVIPLKIGVQLDPPAIVYIYKQSGSMRMRKMPLRVNFWPNMDVEFVLEDLRNRHGDRIADVPDRALRRMLNIVKLNKQGKGLKEILDTGCVAEESRVEKNEAVFDRLRNNVKSVPNDSSAENDKPEKSVFKKKEFPQRTSFSTLYDSGKESSRNKENLIASNNKFAQNKSINDFGESRVKRPTTLELNKFELSTSFNTFSPPDKKPLKRGFLQDLEKDLAGLDFPEKDASSANEEKVSVRPGFARASEKQIAKLPLRSAQNQSKPEENVRAKRDDDTDVEFDDSDNPLDDPEEDFW